MRAILSVYDKWGLEGFARGLSELKLELFSTGGTRDVLLGAGIPVASVEKLRETLQRAGKTHKIHVYPGAGHAFFNDTRPAHRPEAARDAWERTLAWFQRYLVP